MNPYEPPQQPVSDRGGPVERYEDVPWFRKSGFNSLMVVLGLCCGPFILAVCIILLTGDVYYNTYDDQGRLNRWSFANKVVAVIILVLQVLYFGAMALGSVV
tara:strand:+ start:414 stop:719 length:306 start_codon:yes stop_codon:yes gene_type:complete